MVRDAKVSNVSRSNHPLWKYDEAVLELARIGAIALSLRRTGAGAVDVFFNDISTFADRNGYKRSLEGNDYYPLWRLISFENLPNSYLLLDALAAFLCNVFDNIEKEIDNNRKKYIKSVVGKIDVLQAFKDYRSGKLKVPVVSLILFLEINLLVHV